MVVAIEIDKQVNDEKYWVSENGIPTTMYFDQFDRPKGFSFMEDMVTLKLAQIHIGSLIFAPNKDIIILATLYILILMPYYIHHEEFYCISFTYILEYLEFHG